MFKTIWNLIRAIFVVALLALIFQQFTARFILMLLLRTDLGVPVEVEHAQIDFLKAQVRFQNVEIWNPDGFPPGVMIYIREISADSGMAHLFQGGGFHGFRLELDIDNIRLDQSADRRLNLLSLRVFQKPNAFFFLKNFPTDNFILSMDRASFHDEGRQGPAAFSQEIELHRMTYRKVKSLRDIVDILSWETLKKMKLENLGEGFLDQIREDLDGRRPGKIFSAPKAAVWH